MLFQYDKILCNRTILFFVVAAVAIVMGLIRVIRKLYLENILVVVAVDIVFITNAKYSKDHAVQAFDDDNPSC